MGALHFITNEDQMLSLPSIDPVGAGPLGIELYEHGGQRCLRITDGPASRIVTLTREQAQLLASAAEDLLERLMD